MSIVDPFEPGAALAHDEGVSTERLAEAARPHIFAHLARVDAQLAALQAERVRLLERLGEEALMQAELNIACDESRDPDRERNLQWRSVTTELAASANLGADAAQRQLAEAWSLTEKCEASLQAMEAGEISFAHARVIAREVAELDAAAAAAAQEALLPLARRLSVGLFARKCREVLDSRDPERLADRHERAYARRNVAVEGARDGMATLTAYLDAADAAVIGTGLHNAALELQGSGDPRTRRQIEADLAVELLMERQVIIVHPRGDDGANQAGETTAKSVRDHAPINVELLVPAATAAGSDTAPGKIRGVGMIDPAKARALLARAPSLRRILTDPITSAIVDFDRTTYRVPAELKRMILVRDEHCRAPNCARAIAELDHTIDYARGGPTAQHNLAGLCANHHHLKHESGWSLVQYADGVLDWIGPTGRRYETRPDPVLPGDPPQGQWGDYAGDAPFDLGSEVAR